MANGWPYLLLTEAIGWEEFPDYARAVGGVLGATLGRSVDFPDIRMRSLRVGFWRRYWLVFDDFPWGVTLEPRSPLAARSLTELHAHLEPWARRQEARNVP